MLNMLLTPKMLSRCGLVSMLMLTSCSSDNFKGGGNKGEVPPRAQPSVLAPEVPGLHNIKLTCEGENPSTNSFTNLQGKSTDSVRIDGEFCPSAFAEMSILFVVDFSGSMAGNDPTGPDGTCGRLRSAQSIIARITQKVRPQDKVNVSVVGFSAGANLLVPMTPIAVIGQALTGQNFCGQSGSTNYGAAFQAAQQALTGSTGGKTIYFISDGQPSISSGSGRDTQAEQQGLLAAQALKSAMPTAAINAIFLQPTNGVDPGFNPQAYLAEITGSPDRVRLASNASTLAEEILKFAFPDLEVVENTAKGILKVEASAALGTIQIEKFERHATKKGVWSYITLPFKVQGKKDVETVNQVSITAQDKTGKEQSANVVISYKQLD